MIRRHTWDNVANDDATLAQLLGLDDERPWLGEAVCASTDPAIFFPHKGGDNRAPKRICQACPVLEACREWSIPRTELTGIFGGMSDRERKAERARRRAAA